MTSHMFFDMVLAQVLYVHLSSLQKEGTSQSQPVLLSYPGSSETAMHPVLPPDSCALSYHSQSVTSQVVTRSADSQGEDTM